jgi:histidinol-phosphate aminotransferase
LSARLNAQRPRFNVTTPAQAAAVAALADEAYLARSFQLNADGREQLAAGLAGLGLACIPSSGNFLMVRVGDGQAVHARLLATGIAVSTLDNYGLPQWLRITVGLPAQNERVLAALRESAAVH